VVKILAKVPRNKTVFSRLKEDEKNEVDKIANELEVSISDFVRELILNYIEVDKNTKNIK